MPFKYATLQERLLANSKEMRLRAVDPAQSWTAKPCRIWTGKIKNSGYGDMTMRSRYRDKRTGHRKKKHYAAHRMSLALFRGVPVWRLNHVLHLCDNKPCIEPTHLWASTQKANVRDCVAKGRHRNGATGPLDGSSSMGNSAQFLYGERSARAARVKARRARPRVKCLRRNGKVPVAARSR